jgi:hypothetical protein
MAAGCVGRFCAGSFEGPKLKGTALPGGACWMLMHGDDVFEKSRRGSPLKRMTGNETT